MTKKKPLNTGKIPIFRGNLVAMRYALRLASFKVSNTSLGSVKVVLAFGISHCLYLWLINSVSIPNCLPHLEHVKVVI